MAVFGIEDNLFRCRKCDNIFFEEVDIKSYVTDDKKIAENTSTKSIKCIKCGEYHDISEEYDIIEQA